MQTISLHELNMEHLSRYDQFIPVYAGKKLDLLELDCQLAEIYEPQAVAVIVEQDGFLGTQELARKIDAIGLGCFFDSNLLS